MAKLPTNMTCPNCGQAPKSIHVYQGAVMCDCHNVFLRLPEPGKDFIKRYKALVQTDEVINEAAKWFKGDVAVAGFFLGWLGLSLTHMEQAHGGG